jgi:hypothetical protein
MLETGSEGGGGGIMQWAAALATVLVTVGGAALYVPPLVSSRPPTPSDVKSSVLGDEDVPARDWQDPFKAIADEAAEAAGGEKAAPPDASHGQGAGMGAVLQSLLGKDRTAGEDHGLQILKNAIQEGASHQRVLLLPVMVESDPSGDLTEQRLRVRIAVADALSICGYAADDPRHIGYAMVPWPSAALKPAPDTLEKFVEFMKAPAGAGDRQQLIVPYERWSVAKPRGADPWAQPPFDQVVVLWLAEEMFADVPLTRLAGLLQGIVPDSQTNAPKAGGVNVRVVGPRGSTTLAAMLPEASQDLSRGLKGVEIFAATPTAEEALLSATFPTSACSVAAAVGHNVRLERTTLTDDVVTGALAHELFRRGVTSKEPVAIIGEWDSVYGRSLPLSFIAKFANMDINDLLNNPSQLPPNIHRFRYLTGIDGEVRGKPSKTNQEATSSDTPEDQPKRGFSLQGSSVEQPQGPDQADYLRRLADQLAEVDHHLHESGQRLRAVGILGTDLYDKLMVLRALRDRLPDALFFTTGLDSRYALPQEWSATHNLICASSFGLRLHSYFQQGIMPFRDSDQTATFYGTLRAVLANDPSSVGKVLESRRSLGSSRLFEIGRGGPVELTIDAANLLSPDGANRENVAAAAPSTGVPLTVHPPRYNMPRLPGHWALWGGLAAVVVGIISGLARAARAPAHVQVLIFGPVLIGLFVYLLSLHKPVDGEPAELLQRVNIWPTEALRLLTAFLSIYSVIVTVIGSRRIDRKIEAQFGLPVVAPRPAATASNWNTRLDRARGVLNDMKTGVWLLRGKFLKLDRREPVAQWDLPAQASRLRVSQLWVRYVRAADWGPRMAWALIPTAVFILVALLLRHLLAEPLPPTRWTRRS